MRKRLETRITPWSATRRVLGDGGTYWYFIPPKDALKSGLLKSRNLGGDTKKAIAEAAAMKERYEKWRRGEGFDPLVIPRGSWQEAADLYQQSPGYLVELGESTRASYRSGLKAFLGEPCPWSTGKVMGQTLVADLTEDRANELYRQLQKFAMVGDRMKPTRLSMANLAMAVASKVWQMGRSKGFVSGDNPTLLVSKATPVNDRALWTLEDVQRYVAVAWERTTFWRGRYYPVRSVGIAAALQFELSQRQGDVLSLKWEDWDGTHFKIVPSKTERRVGRTIYPTASEWTVDLLHQLRRINNPKPSDYIVTNERTGTRYRGPGALRKMHVGILKEAGLSPDLTLLDLRRSGINEMIDAGVDALHAIAQSGHADIRTLANIYRQPSKRQTTSVRAKINAHRNGK
jgi:integrase